MINKIFFLLVSSYSLSAFANIEQCRAFVDKHGEHNPKVLQMFDETTDMWNEYYKTHKETFDLNLLLEATAFSAEKHEGQYRKDAAATPYIIHPIGVARSLFEEGQVRNVNVLVAALLHDTLEDTSATPEEIEKKFGKRVRLTVEELTNDPTLTTTEETKAWQIAHAPQMSLNAQLVKLADRLYNVRDLRIPPPSWSQDKVETYRVAGDKLLKALTGTNDKLEALLEKELADQRKA